MSDFLSNFDPGTNSEAQGECERLATLLTAFFDGEATAEESRLARQHVVQCARCAISWESWKRTRYLLQTTPVPPVPVGLLVRILLACRLSALPRRVKQPVSGVERLQPTSLKAHDVAMLEAQRTASLPTPDDVPSAPLAAAIPLVPVPPNLKAEILKRTVGSQKLELETPPLLPATTKAGSRWDFGLTLKFAPSRRFNRFMGAVAVPAVTAWMIIASQQVPPSQVIALSQVPVDSTVAKSTGEAGVVQARQRLAKLPIAPPQTAPALVTQKANVQSVPAPAAPMTTPVIAMPHTVALDSNSVPESSIKMPKFDQVDAHTVLAAYHLPAKPVVATMADAGKPVAEARTNDPGLVHIAVRPQILRRVATPRLTLASTPLPWSRSHQEMAEQNTDNGLRKLRPSIIDSAPRDASKDDANAQGDDDTTVDVSNIGDHRPEEVRQVIDGYRAALLTDSSDSDATDDGNSS
ncbi:MAG: zf-HC2 domain-containing protein [Abitibacteriaceae bacterium]|nr:zf-HC2 domain-containing protein [Abditibacteriaceae bacterium]MBV9866901.1 zf-HC2 domain-containing protein [Abditibacteriaceae bacterium]